MPDYEFGGGVTRRAFLTALGAAPVVAATSIPASAGAARHQRPARFAVVTDTHANLSTAERTADLARVMAHIQSRDPDFVLNCGDITDYGVDDEFARYRSAIPRSLAPLVHHVPGNHEAQWNADAWEAFHRWFGPTHYSFTAAGLHLVAMDPLVSQQWPPWQFGRELLEFLRDDLRKVPRHTPIVLFNHFPLSSDWFFVYNHETLLEVIEPYRVRVAFAGHIHRRQIASFNGLTQIVGNAIINGPVYYWAQRDIDADGDRLVVSEVMVPSGGDVTETVVVTAPLTDPGPAGDLGPLRLSTAVNQKALDITVNIPDNSEVSHVDTRLYPQGAPAAGWSALTRSGDQFAGKLDISALPPGRHRLQVRSSDGGTASWEQLAPFDIPVVSTTVAWVHDLGAPIMADVAGDRDLVVAATTDGVVAAFVATPNRGRVQWVRTIGGVFKGPEFTPDGSTVLVGSADHRLYAFDRETGRTRWVRDLGAPVQCGIAIVGDRAVVAAGHELFALDLHGSVIWQADLHGIFTGEVCADDTQLYAGSGDGNTYAFDIATGKKLWATQCSLGGDTYHVLLNSPFAARMRILPAGDVLSTTASGAYALNRADGTIRWSRTGLARVAFTPPVVSDFGVLIFDGATGTAYLLDAGSGETQWSDSTLPTSWGAAPVPTADSGVYLMAANNGLFARIDLKNRVTTALLQLSEAFSTSTAALVDQDLVVTANNSGQLIGAVGFDGQAESARADRDARAAAGPNYRR